MRIKILKPGGLAKSKKLEVEKTILNCIYFFNIFYDVPTCCSHKTPYKDIGAYGHAYANETFRTEGKQGYVTTKLSQCRADSNEATRHIKHSLLGGVLRENGGLGDIKL